MLIKEKIPLIFGVPHKDFYKGLKAKKVFVAELRPSLEGAKKVAAELLKHRIQPIVICDNMMAFCMERKLVSIVHIFGAARRDCVVLCRTGSLVAAIAARAHHIGVVLHRAAAGAENKAQDLLRIAGRRVTSGRIKTYVPEYEEVLLELVSRIEEGF